MGCCQSVWLGAWHCAAGCCTFLELRGRKGGVSMVKIPLGENNTAQSGMMLRDCRCNRQSKIQFSLSSSCFGWPRLYSYSIFRMIFLLLCHRMVKMNQIGSPKHCRSCVKKPQAPTSEFVQAVSFTALFSSSITSLSASYQVIFCPAVDVALPSCPQ